MTAGIDMGTGAGGESSTLDLEELLATRLLVQGNSGSGKSHLLRRLLEQSAGWVQQVIIDPEGDFVTLADRYGHVVIEGERTEAELLGTGDAVRRELTAAAPWSRGDPVSSNEGRGGRPMRPTVAVVGAARGEQDGDDEPLHLSCLPTTSPSACA